MTYTAYAGIFMPADSPEDGWNKIVAHFRACEERRRGWTGGIEAIYLEPVYSWHVRPAVFQ
jgi:hypothetical protein